MKADQIPCKYPSIPEGHSTGEASHRELQLAGFHGGPDAPEITRPAGTAPLSELLVPGVVTKVPIGALLEADVYVLLDPDGQIVATWDEGRWWTPEESDAFTKAVVEEIREQGAQR